MSYSTTYCPLCRCTVDKMKDWIDPWEHIEDYHGDVKQFTYQTDFYNEQDERTGYDLMILEEGGGFGNYPMKLVK